MRPLIPPPSPGPNHQSAQLSGQLPTLECGFSFAFFTPGHLTVSLLHCPVLRHQTQRLSVARHMNGCRREIKEVKAIQFTLKVMLAALKGGYKRHKPLFICTRLLFIIFWVKMIQLYNMMTVSVIKLTIFVFIESERQQNLRIQYACYFTSRRKAYGCVERIRGGRFVMIRVL